VADVFMRGKVLIRQYNSLHSVAPMLSSRSGGRAHSGMEMSGNVAERAVIER
jgi:hypothetical protein